MALSVCEEGNRPGLRGAGGGRRREAETRAKAEGKEGRTEARAGVEKQRLRKMREEGKRRKEQKA